MKKKIIGIIVLAAILLLALLVIKRAREKNNLKPPLTIADIQEEKGFPVRTRELIRADIENTISVDGTIESDRKALLVSRYDRKIDQIKADEGDAVKEGEILVVLENKAVGLRLDAARSALAESEKDLARAQTLFASGAISRQSLAQAQVETDRLRAGWQERVEELGDMFITSPLTGFVSHRYKEPGELSGAGDPILEVVDIGRVDIVCRVSEQSIGNIHEGQPVRITIDAYPKQTWEGRVASINPTADSVSRLFNVKITLNNPDYLLRPGMYARVVIVQDIHEAAMVMPQNSLVMNEQGVSGVYQVCEDGIARFHPIITGIRIGGMVEIVEGLEDDCRIVIEGQDKLSDGARVRLEENADNSEKEE